MMTDVSPLCSGITEEDLLDHNGPPTHPPSCIRVHHQDLRDAWARLSPSFHLLIYWVETVLEYDVDENDEMMTMVHMKNLI